MNSRLNSLRHCRTCFGILNLLVALNGHGQPNAAPEVAASAGGSDSAPRIAVAAPVYDFGRIKAGTVVRHDFVVKNTGGTELEIRTVSPGCGCTTAGDWDRRIAPGSQGVIPLQLSTTGFTGNISKHIGITSNDPKNPNVSLEIKGVVWNPIDISPTVAVFSVNEGSEAPATRSVRIVSHLEQPITISTPRPATDAFGAELIALRPGHEFELRITARPPFAPGTVSVPISLQTSSKEIGDLSVAAHLIVQPSIATMPERISLPAAVMAPTTPAVTIRNNSDEEVQISSATVNIPTAEVRTEVLQPNRLFRVSVTFPAGFEIGRHSNAELVVHTNHSRHPVLRIPIVTAAAPRIVVRQSPAPVQTPPNAATTPGTEKQ